MNLAHRGDLVYLPASITLIKTGDTSAPDLVTEWAKLEEPSIVLVTDSGSLDPDTPYIGVHYQGSSWKARKVDCLEVVGEKNDD
jgi:hypothetical protein